MPITNFKVKSFDGLELNCRKWSPETTPRARVLFIHGYSEFLDAYEDWFPLVADAGIEVIMYDQRGHGATARTQKDYGVSNERCIAADLECMVDSVTKDYTGKLILWGFSMGGAICLNYMILGKQKSRFDMYISVGPYIETSKSTNRGLNAIKLAIAPYVAKIWPTYVDYATLNPQMTNNNPDKWDEYHKQPQRHLRSTAEFMNDAVNRGKRLLDPNFVKNIVDKPLLLSHGTGDLVCEFSAAEKFFEIAKLSDKTLDVYEGLPHELMQCVEKDRLEHWKRIEDWIDTHLAN